MVQDAAARRVVTVIERVDTQGPEVSGPEALAKPEGWYSMSKPTSA